MNHPARTSDRLPPSRLASGRASLRSREAIVVIAGLVLSLMIRLAYAHYLRGQRLPGDAYATGLRAIAVGTDWVYGSPESGLQRYVSTTQPPLFTMVLAVFRQVTHSQTQTSALMAGLSSITVGLVWWTARREFGRTVGYVALALGGLYVHMLTQGGMLMSEVLAQLLAAVLLLVVPVAVRELRLLPAAAAGAVCALAALTRSELVLLTLVVGLALLVAGIRRFGWARPGRLVAVPAIFALTMLVGMAPWAYYTSQTIGRPVLSTGSGYFQLATSCDTSLSGDLVGLRDIACLFEARGYLTDPKNQELTLGRTVNDLYIDRTGSERASEVLAKADVNMVTLRGIRVARGFGIYRPFDSARLEVQESIGGPQWLADIEVIQWLVMLVLAAPGLIFARRRGMALAAVLGLGAAAVGALALGFGLSRYRAAFDPAVVLMAAVGAVGLWDQLRRWRSRLSA